MKKRNLGRSGIEVPTLCLGGNVFGWTADESASFNILDALVESGLNFVDTADTYSRWVPGNQGGESETIIGKWMKKSGNRGRMIIATKVGMDMGNGKQGLAAKYIRTEVEDSLRRLQTDYIDLYQSHTDDAATPLEETLGAYQELIKAGKVRAIGASNYNGARLQDALDLSAASGLPRYESLQPNYNLYNREGFEKDLEPVCEHHHVGVIPYYSLASGFLTGKYRSEADLGKSARGKGVQQYLNPRGFRILDALDIVAANHKVSQAQVALAWLIARPSITAPIASATSIDQLKDLVAATRLELTHSEIESLDLASS